MEMSKAALPPIQPTICDSDRTDPLFPKYMEHRSFCSQQLIQASGFKDFKYQHDNEAMRAGWAAHPQYPAFLSWMRANQGGARKCPAGSTFPSNFKFWLEGGRW